MFFLGALQRKGETCRSVGRTRRTSARATDDGRTDTRTIEWDGNESFGGLSRSVLSIIPSLIQSSSWKDSPSERGPLRMPSKTINLNPSPPLFSPTFRQTLSASIYSTSCAPPLSLLLGLPGAHNSIRRSFPCQPVGRLVVGRSTTLLVRVEREGRGR